MVNENALAKLFSYNVAARQLITPGDRDCGVLIQSTSPMTATGMLLMKRTVRAQRRTVISLIYDLSGDSPRLDRVWMMMPATNPAAIARGEDLTLLADCKLWAPANDGAAVIVAPPSLGGYFALSSDGTRLVHRRRGPARGLTAGRRRAERRMEQGARVVASRSDVRPPLRTAA